MAPPKKTAGGAVGKKPKRPLSGYMLWLRDNRADLAKMVEDPKKVTLISKKAGELWRAMGEKEKEKWQKMAAAEKQRHKADA